MFQITDLLMDRRNQWILGLPLFWIGSLFLPEIVLASGDEEPPGRYGMSDPSACSISGAIVFVSDRSGDVDLWMLDRKSGQKLILLPWPDSNENAPDWSPRCDRIAFCSTRGAEEDGLHVWTVNPDGTDPRQITFGPGMNKSPRWSPDGRSILFSANRSGPDSGLYVIPSDGGPERLIYEGGFPPAVNGSWSPDGGRVAFIQCSGSCQVYSLVLGQTIPTALTSGGANKLGADWGHKGILTTTLVDGRGVALCVDPNGPAPKQVSFPPHGSSDFDVRWDPFEGGILLNRVGPTEEVWVRIASGEEHQVGRW